MINFNIKRGYNFKLNDIIEYLNYEGFCYISLQIYYSRCPFCFDLQTEIMESYIDADEMICVGCKNTWKIKSDNSLYFDEKPEDCEEDFDYCNYCPSYLGPDLVCNRY